MIMSGSGVFFNVPAYGHLNPTLALVRELVARGERIDYYSTPAFKTVIEATGARFCSLPLHGVANNNLEDFHLLGALADVVETTHHILPQLLPLVAKQSYDYLVADWFTLWGRLAARALNIPLVLSCPVFALHPKVKEPPHSKLQLLQTPFRTVSNLLRLQKYYQRLRQQYPDLPSNPEQFILQVPQTPCLVFTSKTLQPQADLFGPQYHFVGPSLDAAVRERLPNFPYACLEGERPLVYISLGSLLEQAKFYRQCIQAFQDASYTVVLNIGKRLAPSDFPAASNIVVCNHAPQLEVLQRAAVFITHGGMNSAQEGLYHQVPLLVIPQVSDQFLVADVVQKRGLGCWLPSYRVTPKRLRQWTEQLMKDQAMHTRLAQASQTLRQAGGYQRAADVVLQAVGRQAKE